MESGSRKNDDCYFYYYSTCTKGSECLFRHEPTALGCEVTCNLWQQGKCINSHCNLRHMLLKKNRKMIPCYWEMQPTGCTKPHCPFQHSVPRDNVATTEAPIVQKNHKTLLIKHNHNFSTIQEPPRLKG